MADQELLREIAKLKARLAALEGGERKDRGGKNFPFSPFLPLLSVLLFAAVPIATESVTLTTYYPAPAGVYNNMVTIGNTWLARDNVPATGQPSFLELGGSVPVSNGTKLAVLNGSVGIGTTTPSGFLDVEGTAACF